VFIDEGPDLYANFLRAISSVFKDKTTLRASSSVFEYSNDLERACLGLFKAFGLSPLRFLEMEDRAADAGCGWGGSEVPAKSNLGGKALKADGRASFGE